MACFNLDSVLLPRVNRANWLKIFDTCDSERLSRWIFGKEIMMPEFVDALAELIKNHKTDSVRQLVKASKWPQERHEQPLSFKFMRLFLFKIFNIVVPLRLCGSFKNKRLIMMFLGKIPTKGRYETINIGHVLEKIDLLSIEWMHTINELEKKSEFFNKVLSWLIESYICGLLDYVFVVVKTTYNNKLVYYWKSTWNEVCRETILKLCKKGKYDVVSDVTESMWKVGGGIILRFRSKKAGVLRPLMLKSRNIKHTIVPGNVTRIVRQFLNGLYNKVSSQTSFNKGSNFLQKWSEKYPYWKGRKVHFVKMDVKDAFGSVNHTLMKCIIKVHIRRYVNPGQVIAVKTVTTKSNKTRVLFDIFDEDFSVFQGPVKKYPIELVFGVIVKSFECCIFRWRKNFYKLQCGLPQGSELSPLLCNFYLNALDQKYLQEFVSESTLLVREMDDYLFITTSLDEAAKFYKFMQNGIEEFNVKMNSKTETSDTHHEISYLKYIINTEDLEIGYNYSKYASGDLVHCLSLKCITQQERFIKDTIRITCVLTDVLVTATFNSPRTVLKILFQCAYLQASRMHIMLYRLLQARVREGLVIQCCHICANVIEKKALRRFQIPDVGTYVTVRAFYEQCKPFARYQKELENLFLQMKKLQRTIGQDTLEIESVIQDLVWRTNGDPLKNVSIWNS